MDGKTIIKDGVFGILETENGILLVKHSYGEHKWSLPGGGIEDNESSEEAIIRELLEETGINIEIVSQIGIFCSRKYISTVNLFLVKEINRTYIHDEEVEEIGFFNGKSSDLRDLNIYLAQKIFIAAWFLKKNGIVSNIIEDYQSYPKMKELTEWMN